MYNKKTEKVYLFIIPRMCNGGAERVMATLANELALDNKNKIIILSLTSSYSFYTLNKKVKIVGAGYEISSSSNIKRKIDMFINGVKSIYFIKSRIKEYNPDIVISFLTHTNLLSVFTKIFNPKIKLIISERCEPRVRGFFIRKLTKYMYPLANYIVCQSNQVCSFFPKYSQKKIAVIPNPVNLNAISNDFYEVRKKIIVAVGRLFEQKNFDLLIDSFYDIKDEFPEHILEIYGEGQLRKSLENKIIKLNLQNRVFLKGVKNEVMKYVADYELFVMSSNFEGFPNVLVEAMASGLPVISTDFSTGVARELVKEKNGIIVPVGDRKLMSNAIRQILLNKSCQKIMSEENRKIKEKLSPKVILKQWEKLINDTL